MNIEVREKRVLSSDGVHTLVGRVYIPDVAPRAIFHVVHGMTEYIGRYDPFMREMAAKLPATANSATLPGATVTICSRWT